MTGHPLEEYEKLWKDNITAKSTDFLRDEGTGQTKLADNSIQTIGGLISDITVRQTRKGDTMAIISVEDLLGSVEVLVWPKIYAEKNVYENSSRDDADNAVGAGVSGAGAARAILMSPW